MITIDGVQYRNLMEQVQKNKEDIARHYAIDRVIADFGIRVLGKVDTPEQLPEGPFEYGDAYVISQTIPYLIYIWTRNAVSQGVDGWMNIGSLSVQGPEGKSGKDGKDGKEITSITKVGSPEVHSGYTTNNIRVTYNDGSNQSFTLSVKNGNDGVGIGYLTNGPVTGSPKNGAKRSYIFNLTDGTTAEFDVYDGYKGDKGETGDRGPTGYVYTIKSTLSSATLLPNPTQELRSTAYLIGSHDPYHLYIILEDEDVLKWTDVGTMTTAGASTQVLVNGQFVEEWNADNKLDKSATTDLDMNNHSITTVETIGAQTVKASVIKDVAGNNPVLNCDTGVAMLSSIQNNNGKNAITFSTTNDSITLTQPLFGMSGIGGNNVKASDYLITDDIKGNTATRAIGIYNDIDMQGNEINNVGAIKTGAVWNTENVQVFNFDDDGTMNIEKPVYFYGNDITGVSNIYPDSNLITIKDSAGNDRMVIDTDDGLTMHNKIYMDGNEIDDVSAIYFYDGTGMETAPHLYNHYIAMDLYKDGIYSHIYLNIYSTNSTPVNDNWDQFKTIIGDQSVTFTGNLQHSGTGRIFKSTENRAIATVIDDDDSEYELDLQGFNSVSIYDTVKKIL